MAPKRTMVEKMTELIDAGFVSEPDEFAPLSLRGWWRENYQLSTSYDTILVDDSGDVSDAKLGRRT